jgi:mono/diheme cytochrome c family protein
LSRPRKPVLAVLSLLSVAALGCWEQVSSEWFPQMKRQLAVQPFEQVLHRRQLQGFMPPPGTVPVGAAQIPDVASMDLQLQEALPNPTPGSYASLKRGDVLYHRYCITCHGPEGLGDGPVAASSPFAPHAKGPFSMVFPLAGPLSMSKIVTDGHIYTTMTLGRNNRMPNHNRIPAEQRWDLVNYIRELNRPGDQR